MLLRGNNTQGLWVQPQCCDPGKWVQPVSPGWLQGSTPPGSALHTASRPLAPSRIQRPEPWDRVLMLLSLDLPFSAQPVALGSTGPQPRGIRTLLQGSFVNNQAQSGAWWVPYFLTFATGRVSGPSTAEASNVQGVCAELPRPQPQASGQ